MALEHVFVDKEELQNLLNEAKYYDRVQTGEFKETFVYDDWPNPDSGQRGGARSIRSVWRDSQGRYMATVHYFRNPDWSLGASGKPDPTRVRIGGKLYIIKRQKDRWRFLRNR